MKSILFRLVLALAAFAVVPNAFAADGGNILLDAKVGETFGGDNAHSGLFSNGTCRTGFLRSP